MFDELFSLTASELYEHDKGSLSLLSQDCVAHNGRESERASEQMNEGRSKLTGKISLVVVIVCAVIRTEQRICG